MSDYFDDEDERYEQEQLEEDRMEIEWDTQDYADYYGVDPDEVEDAMDDDLRGRYD